MGQEGRMTAPDDLQTDDRRDADTTPLPARPSRGRWLMLALAGGVAFGALHRHAARDAMAPEVAVVATLPPGAPTPTPLARPSPSPFPPTATPAATVVLLTVPESAPAAQPAPAPPPPPYK